VPIVQPVLEANNHLGETPLWSAKEQALYWINCEKSPEIHRWHPDSSEHRYWSMPERVGGIALTADPHILIVVLSRGVHRFDIRRDELIEICRSPLPSSISLHETCVDRQGRLWVGAYDHDFNPTQRDARGGMYFRLDNDALTPVYSNISVANALAFCPSGHRMYFADSPTRQVLSAGINPLTGAMGTAAPFLTLGDGDGFVDGATVDAEGGYWLAAVGSGTLRRYFSDGKLDRVIDLPVSNPTSVTFGGPTLATLYITTTQLDIGANSEANGAIFAFDPGERGLAEPLVALS